MRFLLPFALLTAASIATADSPDSDQPVSYWRDIAPILKKNCVACHREGQTEGGLSLETPEALQRGGDSGELFDPKQSIESLIYVRVTDEDEIMPPDDNSVGAKRLTEKELLHLKRWIEQGATIDERESEEFGWQPIPDTIRSSYTLSISPDDALVAIGHANRVGVADATTGKVIQRLVDSSLPYPGVADYDFVQAIAFSPDGNRIATGGFRTVRIWKQESVTAASPSAMLLAAAGPLAVNPDRTQAVLVNGIGDLEIWSLTEDTRVRVLPSLKSEVTALQWPTPDRLVVGFNDGVLAVLSTGDGAPAGQISLPQAPIEIASLDTKTIVIRTVDGTVRWIRDFVEVEQASLKGITNSTALAVVAQPQPAFAIATENGEVHLVDLKNAATTKTVSHGAAVRSLAVHPFAPQLLSAGDDGAAKLWNLADGKLLQTFAGDPIVNLRLARAARDSVREESWLKDLESQRDGLKKALEKEEASLKKVSDARDKAVAELNEQTKKLDDAKNAVSATEAKIVAAKKRMEASKTEADSMTEQIAAAASNLQKLTAAVSPMEQKLVVASETVKSAEQAMAQAMKALQAAKIERDSAIAQRDAAKKAAIDEKTRVDELNVKLTAANKVVADTSAEIDRESKTLEAQKKTRDAADVEKTKKQAEADKRNQALVTAQATRDRAAASIPSHEDKIRKRTSRVGVAKQRHSTEVSRRQDVAIASVAFNPDATKIALVAEDDSVRTFETVSARAIARYELPPQRGTATNAFYGDTTRLLCCVSEGRPVEVRLAKSWVLERTLGGIDGEQIPDRVTALNFRPDGQTLAIGSGVPSRSGTILIVSLADGSVLREFDSLHSDTVLAVQFSPDGRVLASGSSDKTIRLVDVQSRHVIGSLDGHTHHVMSLAWKRDGKLIASASADKSIKVWDARTSQQRRTIGGIPDELTAIQFLKDSSEVAITCANGDVRVYNVDNGKMLRRAVAGEFLFTLGTTSDGTRILTGGQSGDVKVWNSADVKLTGTWKE